MLDRKIAQKVLAIYAQAWERQDSNLILSIFTAEATYQEGPFAEPLCGHKEIKAYWEKKVVREQKNIQFKLEKILIEGSECAVEWYAEFDDLVTHEHVCLFEVAFLTFQDEKISALRETWRAKRVALASMPGSRL